MDALDRRTGDRRVLVVANRRAGRCGARWRRRHGQESPVERIAASLETMGVGCEFHLSTGPEDALAAARQGASEAYDAVVAAGGDGTLRTVADGLVGTGMPMGLLPMGTENVLARAMGVPLDLEGACRHLVRSPVREMDTGRINGRHFVCFAGLGFDAQVVEEVDFQVKEAIGSMAYVAAALGAAWKHRDLTPRVRLRIDGREAEHDFWLILVGNIPLYGGQLRLTPRACPRDGLLDVCVFQRTDLPGTLRQWAAAAMGAHAELPDVAYYLGRDIELETDPPVPYQVDGDSGGVAPCSVRVIPAGLRVRF